MTRKKNTKPIGNPPANPEGQAVLEALRSNMSLLGELAARYEVAIRPDGPEDPPSIGSPHDVYRLLGPEMSTWPRSSCAFCCSTTRTRCWASGWSTKATSIRRWSELPRCSGPPSSRPYPASSWFTTTRPAIPTPARNDVLITRKLKQAAELLDIELLDHVVIGTKRHVSLKNRGLMAG